jgi:hypothetical protein
MLFGIGKIKHKPNQLSYMTNKQTPWPLVCKQTKSTERPPLGQRGGIPTAVNLSFLDRSRYFSFK